jgi:hypothetical protein
MGNGTPFWIAVFRLEPVAMPEDEHVEVTVVDVVQATLTYRVAVWEIAVNGLMPRRHEPFHHGLPFRREVGNSGRYLNLRHQSLTFVSERHPCPPRYFVKPSVTAASVRKISSLLAEARVPSVMGRHSSSGRRSRA